MLAQERELGFQHAMRAANIDIEDGWVVEGDLTLDAGMRGAGSLLRHPKPPTAIFCINDEMALGCLHAARQTGLNVPDDLSILGFDDIRYTSVSDPPLSTIARPAEEIGRCLMRRIDIDLNDGAPIEISHDIVPYRLVIRDSVAKPRIRKPVDEKA